MKSLERYVFLCLAAVLMTGGVAKATADMPVMNIAYSESAPVMKPFQRIAVLAYHQLGYKVHFHDIPSGRSLIMTNAGELDAELIRGSFIEDSQPNLLRVPVLLTHAEMRLYCLPALPCDESVLEQGNSIIGLVAGFNIGSLVMQDRPASIYTVKTYSDLAKLLQLKRLNYCLAPSKQNGENLLALDDNEVQSVVLKSIDTYHYINKKYRALLPALTKAFAEALRQEGMSP